MNAKVKAKLKALEKAPEQPHQITIYTDGAGARPDGKGSGFAWYRTDTGQKKITRQDGLTNNQAEYHAILSALEYLSKADRAEIWTDSENTCYQLKGERRIRDPKLAEINQQIQNLIENKQLTVSFVWVPRSANLAGKLI
jgi:ribonuclease HI